MRRGTKPAPTAMKLLQGNPGRRPLPPNEPAPGVVAESEPAPDWLGEDARREWARIAPMLARHGVLTELDLDALAAYCRAVATWKAAHAKIAAEGFVIRSPNGYPVQSPYVAIANGAMATMRGLMAEFGMTPSARTHVTRAKDPAAPANPLQRFLDRKR